MRLQIGPCAIDVKVNGSYTPVFTAAEAIITITPSMLYRINDGMKVGGTVESIDVNFEITTLNWSIRLLKEFSVFDSYAAPDPLAAGDNQYHRFSIINTLNSLKDMWLRFASIRKDISSVVEIPHACLEGDIPISFMYGQGDISTKGQAFKIGADPLIIFDVATGVKYPIPESGISESEMAQSEAARHSLASLSEAALYSEAVASIATLSEAIVSEASLSEAGIKAAWSEAVWSIAKLAREDT